ncbi:hypothetical protein IMX26_17115 [Clostridium sp. 'deep sea']|uniref:hypothetical protein n=1 Tax=Clostridium sp. 'deep sea' TaxID=2779445 RepID=UPI001896905C|nr:hypothetical protein [Clostridium sp. 'deep sea']QOR35155.1 hypothetical protein IMX26_17115 [Clostridium sp. 'deep sea']
MINNKLVSLNKIEKFIESYQYSKALLCFSQNINELLSTPNIRGVYKVIARIPKTYFKKAEHKLLYGWLCLEVNNNKGLKWVLAELDFSKMKSNQSRASYLALSSMSLNISRPEKGLYLTQRALTYFEDGDISIARANIYYNYAKQLTSCNLFYMASQNFYEAAKIFEAQKCYYFAITCYVNSFINKCNVGKYDDVVKECYDLLNNNTRLNNKLKQLIKLPLAICFYYKNDLVKSIDLLLEVKKIIKNIAVPSYHILLMNYMIHIYLIQQRTNDVNNLLNEIKLNKMYQQMPAMKQLVIATVIDKEILINRNVSKDSLKVLLDILNTAKFKAPFYVIESLFRLKLLGKINGLKIDSLLSHFSRARDIGNASNIQSMALFLADIYYNKGDSEKTKYHLEIAFKVYQHTGSVNSFYNRKLYCLESLLELDKDFYNQVLLYNNNQRDLA